MVSVIQFCARTVCRDHSTSWKCVDNSTNITALYHSTTALVHTVKWSDLCQLMDSTSQEAALSKKIRVVVKLFFSPPCLWIGIVLGWFPLPSLYDYKKDPPLTVSGGTWKPILTKANSKCSKTILTFQDLLIPNFHVRPPPPTPSLFPAESSLLNFVEDS